MSGLEVFSALLAFVACGMLLCRIDKMLKGVTRTEVFLQHALLAGALFGASMLLFTRYSELALGLAAIGVIGYLGMSMRRWRGKAPDGTVIEGRALDESEMARVNGRGKS